MSEPVQQVPDSVVCPAVKEIRMFIVALVLIAAGAWGFRDGFLNPDANKGESEDSRASYLYFNRSIAIAMPLAGLVALGLGIRDRRRVLLADQEGIGYQGKEKNLWSNLVDIDDSKIKKGLVRLRFQVNGREKKMVLDDQRLRNYQALTQLVLSKRPKAA